MRLLKSDECPSTLHEHVSLDKYLPSHAYGSYSYNVSRAPSLHMQAPTMEQLDSDIFDAVCSLTSDVRQHRYDQRFQVHKHNIVNGIKYTSREIERDSIIFSGNDSYISPGVIRKIFTIKDTTLFAIHRYLKATHNDPFTRWPHFRAGLWLQKLDEKVCLIDPNSTYICHAARRPWRNGENYFYNKYNY